jgi:hypothetical protein
MGGGAAHFLIVGAGDGVVIGVGVCMGVGVGVGVSTVLLQAPTSKAVKTIKARNNMENFFIVFSPLWERINPEGLHVNGFESVALVLPVIYTKLLRERLSPGGLRGLQN